MERNRPATCVRDKFETAASLQDIYDVLAENEGNFDDDYTVVWCKGCRSGYDIMPSDIKVNIMKRFLGECPQDSAKQQRVKIEPLLAIARVADFAVNKVLDYVQYGGDARSSQTSEIE